MRGLRALSVVFALVFAPVGARPAAATFPTHPPCSDLPRLRSFVHSEQWTLPYLTVASLAYVDESDSTITNVSIDLPKAINALPPLPCPWIPLGKTTNGVVPGRWVFEWGPANSPDNANLIYAASYRLFTNTSIVSFNANSKTFPPVLLAIGIRGTDTGTNGTGLVLQLLEDFQPFTTVDWNSNIGSKNPLQVACPLVATKAQAKGSYSPNPALAWGSCVGLKSLMTLASRAATLGGAPTNVLGFLNNYVGKWGTGVRVVVTGHSLGGTQTTASAVYLQQRVNLPNQVKVGAFPFAPSTAGNAAFAALFNSTIGKRSHLYMNSLDLVPHGYQYVVATLGLWFLYGGPLPPSYLIPLVPLVYAGIKDVGYTHPSPSNWMQGRYNPAANYSTDAWASQLEFQHFPPEYYAMLCYYFGMVSGGGSVRKTMADYPLVMGTGVVPGCSAAIPGFTALTQPKLISRP